MSITIEKDSKIISLRLYTSNDADYLCQRPDGTQYIYRKTKLGASIIEVTKSTKH